MEVLTTVERGDIKRHEDDGERRGQRTRGMETANGGDDERQGWRTVGMTVGMGTTMRHNSGARTRQETAGATDNDAERGMTLPNAARQRRTQHDNAERSTTTLNAGR